MIVKHQLFGTATFGGGVSIFQESLSGHSGSNSCEEICTQNYRSIENHGTGMEAKLKF